MSETDGFLVEDRPEGRTLIVTGAWTSAAKSALGRDDVDGLWLNYARGFSEPDLEFLEAMPVRRLHVLDRKLADLAPIERLASTLDHLSVQAAPGAVLDLAAFPCLTSLGAVWRAVRETIADATGLTQLAALEYDERDLWPLAENVALEKLVLKPADQLKSLAGLASLCRLEHLGVFAARHLDDVTDLATARSLRHVELQACPSVDSLDVVAGLARLRFLGVSDCGSIESLGPLSLLQNLEVLHAWGSTRIADAELSPLAGLPRLSQIRMRDRREYEPRLAALKVWKH
jgi:internalin A